MGDDPESGGVDETGTWIDALGPSVVEVLESFVLIDDAPTAWARLDALQYLIDDFDDASDDDRETWMNRRMGRPFHLGAASDGSFVETEAQSAALSTVPTSLVELLISEVFDCAHDDQPPAQWAIRFVIADWYRLLVDDEKLVGHLVRHHDVSFGLDEDHFALIRRHAEVHRTARIVEL